MGDVTKTCRDINELLPVAQKACNLFLEECKKNNIDIFVTETYRSQDRQNYLYEQGRTREGKVVTWTKSSNHTGRLAWDIAVNKPKDLYDETTINRAGEIAKKLGITWGGNWTKPDTPHFEVKSNWTEPNPLNCVTIQPKPTTVVAGSPIVPYPGKPIKYGSKGKDVERIQRALKIPVTGVFDELTSLSLKAYQKRKNLGIDGICGPITWNILF